jgi:hypothetical protein
MRQLEHEAEPQGVRPAMTTQFTATAGLDPARRHGAVGNSDCVTPARDQCHQPERRRVVQIAIAGGLAPVENFHHGD